MTTQYFFRPVIQNWTSSYEPTQPVASGVLKLDAGENQFLPNLKIDYAKLFKKVALYPNSYGTKLRQLLAKDLGVSNNMIALGNGSDELIDLVCRLYLENGRSLLDFTPTFPMYERFAKLCGSKVILAPRLSDFSLDIKLAVRQLKKCQLAFLANPNNPTGTLTSLDQVELLLKVGCPLVIDEAYFEFCDITCLPLMKKYQNLIILRTFSKWAGLAGLRIGYLIAQPQVVEKIQAIKAPYNVNFVAQELAIVALKNKVSIMSSVNDQVGARNWFIKESAQLKNWQVVPSLASCIVIFSKNFSSSELQTKFRQQGIIVKNVALLNAIRVSIGPTWVMKKVLQIMSSIDS